MKWFKKDYVKAFKDACDRNNNKIVLVHPDGRREQVYNLAQCRFMFTGQNNYIEFHLPLNIWQMDIRLSDNSFVQIMPHTSDWVLDLRVKKEPDNKRETKLLIGRNCTSNGTINIEFASGGDSNVIIGDDCMFAYNIDIMTGDWHTIFDKKTKKILNPTADVVIGNHVWVNPGTFIAKGAKIPDNCIVGAKSFVNRKFTTKNSLIAGTPATVVRRGIDWSRDNPEKFASKYE